MRTQFSQWSEHGSSQRSPTALLVVQSQVKFPLLARLRFGSTSQVPELQGFGSHGSYSVSHLKPADSCALVSVCVCVCICLCIYVYVCVFVCVFVCVCARASAALSVSCISRPLSTSISTFLSTSQKSRIVFQHTNEALATFTCVTVLAACIHAGCIVATATSGVICASAVCAWDHTHGVLCSRRWGHGTQPQHSERQRRNQH